jgi:hypothetical protein
LSLSEPNKLIVFVVHDISDYYVIEALGYRLNYLDAQALRHFELEKRDYLVDEKHKPRNSHFLHIEMTFRLILLRSIK